ncbi:MAG: T9SS type A sorting domain-containing protein [Ignavibacterium sp.]
MLHHGDAVTGTIFSTLKGCVIDGKAYGDTTILDVDNLISEIPGEFKLFQNYPNPFNPVTKIKFTIPETVGTKLDLSVLKVYDILGNEVATLVNEYKPAGNYEVEFNAGNLPSGVYIYKLTAGSFVSSKKMMVIK